MAQTVKRLPAMWETRVWSLGQEDPLEKEMATYPSTLAWKIPWMEEPGRPQSMGSPRVRHDWATSLSLFKVITYREGWRINKGWGAQRLVTIEMASAPVLPLLWQCWSPPGAVAMEGCMSETTPRQRGNKEESTQHSSLSALWSPTSASYWPNQIESQSVTEPKNKT